MARFEAGDTVEIDMRTLFFSAAKYVPVTFVRHVTGDKTSSGGDMLVRFQTSNGQPPWGCPTVLFEETDEIGQLYRCGRHYCRIPNA